MKTKNLILIFLFVIVISLLNSCDKDDSIDIPTISTNNIHSVTDSSATSGGYITSEGNSNVTSRGVCWSTTQNPVINNNRTIDGNGSGIYNSYLTGLEPNTTYYVRAYATNSSGTSYGEELIFTTDKAIVPVTAPCNPEKNTIIFHNTMYEYISRISTETHNFSNFGLIGNATWSDMSIRFSQTPATGKFVTQTGNTPLNENECVVTFYFETWTKTYQYFSVPGDTVYVNITDDQNYSMTFCDLQFNALSSSDSFSSDGNLNYD